MEEGIRSAPHLPQVGLLPGAEPGHPLSGILQACLENEGRSHKAKADCAGVRPFLASRRLLATWQSESHHGQDL